MFNDTKNLARVFATFCYPHFEAKAVFATKSRLTLIRDCPGNVFCRPFSFSYSQIPTPHQSLVEVQRHRPQAFEFRNIKLAHSRVLTRSLTKRTNWGSKKRQRNPKLYNWMSDNFQVMATEEQQKILDPLRLAVKEQVRYY